MFLVLCPFSLFSHDKEADRRANLAWLTLQANYKNPGIKEKRFLKAAYYIETHLHLIKNSTNHFLTKKETGLKNSIEYDPVTGHIFILLDSPKAYIGRGVKKKVYKTIEYAAFPKVLARSEQSLPMDEELKAHKELQGAPGIMNAHAFTTHMHKKKTYHTIYSDIYEGTIRGMLGKNKLSFYDKLIIVSDLLTGIHSLHSRNYVHRDLHSGNYLFYTERQANGNSVLRAVIADLGRTLKIHEVSSLRAQMTSRARAPEAITYKNLKGSDYFATDIYALGCIFYRIYYNKFPKWQGEYLGSDAISDAKKKAMLIKKLEKETNERRKELMGKEERSSHERLELLILRMLSVHPADRGSSHELLHELQILLRP